MLYAIQGQEKVSAKPNLKARCQLCNQELIAKCGEIKVWHWAHPPKGSCDSWCEPETLWHKSWKEKFGKEYSEVVIVKNEEKHIADILTKNNVVIELQNSPISKETIRVREQFYGERMLWLINGLEFQNNFGIDFLASPNIGASDKPRNLYKDKKTFGYPVWVVNLNHLEPSPTLENVLRSNGFTKDDETNLNFNSLMYHDRGNWLSLMNELHAFNLSQKSPKRNHTKVDSKDIIKFTWKYPRRSWEESIRPILIDFDPTDDYLFYVLNGMGESTGEGYRVPKYRFLEKYAGI